MSDYLVEVKDLKQYFPIKVGFVKTIPLKAVDGVSFSIKPGETLGLVGESGCGKTTVGRSLLRLYTPTGGEVLYNGEKVDAGSIRHMRKEMQMVFQDPYSSLNPRMTVEDIIGEPLDVHKLYSSKGERRDKIIHLMELVGLNAEHATRYAHEFSGGQRQRIGIARALATNPKFIVCDEAVSALDVSIQAQVINMFEELQDKLGVAYVTGKVASGDAFMVKGDRADWVARTFSPTLCEMEGCAVAQVCLRNGVDFLALKSVSDRLCMDNSPGEYFNFAQAMEKLNAVVLPLARTLRDAAAARSTTATTAKQED